MNKLYKSSTGSGDISLMIKGMVTAFLPLIIFMGKQYGWEITESQVVDFVGLVLAAISAIQLAWGAIRKVYVAIKYIIDKIK